VGLVFPLLDPVGKKKSRVWPSELTISVCAARNPGQLPYTSFKIEGCTGILCIENGSLNSAR
jgi:hypothetical protein